MEKRKSQWAALVVVLLLIQTPVQAEFYKFVDRFGRITYTDQPKQPAYLRLVKSWKGWDWQQEQQPVVRLPRKREQFAADIETAALTHGVPVALVHAVVTAESAYNPQALSSAGAAGLMQLMPETAKRYGVSDRWDPVENINGGTRYLRDLLEMFENDVTLAVAAYNAGENAVLRYGNKIPPYAETQEYVRRVLKYHRRFLELEAGTSKPAAGTGKPTAASPVASAAPPGDAVAAVSPSVRTP